jgi:CRISPR-associated protein Cas1
MLGPGTSITHAAMSVLADNGCLVLWCGEEGVRLYAHGQGKTRHSDHLLHQARVWADPVLRLQVVMRMYRMRFDERLDDGLSLREIRGKEGVRVRETYARTSRETGVAWQGRSYKRERWVAADPVNRALSAANSCLYGICHAAILAVGFSPALGFIHTGKMLSFVYDVADLYKTEITIPVAFREAAASSEGVEGRVRRACRDAFRESQILKRVVPDIEAALGLRETSYGQAAFDFDADEALPGGLWDPEGQVAGGRNFADTEGDGDDGSGSGTGSGGAEG